MIFDYFYNNFMTLMIMSALIAVMTVNKRIKIPMADIFSLSIALLFAITVCDTIDIWIANGRYNDFDVQTLRILRTAADALSYILRPYVILTEVLIILPNKRYKALCVLPAAINTIIYSTAFTDSKLAFYIDDNLMWSRGPLGLSVYLAQLFYILLLLGFSVRYFDRINYKKSIIVLVVVAQSIIVGIVEYKNILTGYANTITALCIFEYYTYLSVIYIQEMRDSIEDKNKRIQNDKMLMLRNQIQPHFIYNSLSLIRSLAKRDGQRAVVCIDNFSDYLKAHIGAIKTDELVPFEQELYNIKVYLSLVQADYTRKTEIVYDLGVTDFMIPPLSLEPIVENAVNHGISKNDGKIELTTLEDESFFIIRISDNGTASKNKEKPKPFHMGIGIENTRKRLDILCKGTLDMDFGENGTTAEIKVPKTELTVIHTGQIAESR